ncbi:MAG: TRAP transporter small permease subunit [Porticoccaceae bacterium]|nr:TRAP transporter small permease subunit [Porticoccaceae bacterium]
MAFLHCFSRSIDRITELSGTLVSWLSLVLIINTVIVVAMRYFFGGGSIALQETMTYIHASLFMLAMAFTLKRGGHVRVDVFYRQFSPKTQALVDAAGTLVFLLPVSVLIFAMSLDYVVSSWEIREVSTESTGLQLVYLLKSLLLVLPLALIFQGLAEFIKNLLFFLGRGDSHSEDKVELL